MPEPEPISTMSFWGYHTPPWRCFFHELLLSKTLRTKRCWDGFSCNWDCHKKKSHCRIWIKRVYHIFSFFLYFWTVPAFLPNPWKELIWCKFEKDLFRGYQIDFDLACAWGLEWWFGECFWDVGAHRDFSICVARHNDNFVRKTFRFCGHDFHGKLRWFVHLWYPEGERWRWWQNP